MRMEQSNSNSTEPPNNGSPFTAAAHLNHLQKFTSRNTKEIKPVKNRVKNKSKRHSHAHSDFLTAPSRLCEYQKPSKSRYYMALYGDKDFYSLVPSLIPLSQQDLAHSYNQDFECV